jgi:hypothetical protein
MMALPTDAKQRKAIPIYSGFVKYFPDAIAAVAELSRKGNDQHNPGKPLHWDRSKSGDELDAQMRHLLDMAADGEDATDTDEVFHATKNAWRAMANLQKLIEKKRERKVGMAPELGMGYGAADGWNEWKGGLCPVEPNVIVSVRLRCGYPVTDRAARSYYWDHPGYSGDIVAWRLA